MPPKGVTTRAETVAFVAALRHERRSSPEMGALLAQLAETSGDPVRDTNAREARRAYERAVSVPKRLVEEIARTAAIARDAWAAARRSNDYAAFSPMLAKLIDLKRKQADAIGYSDHPYDALLDEYEPGTSTRAISHTFSELQSRLVPLVRAIAGARKRPDFSLLQRHCPRAAQEKLCRRVAEELGFDFEAGRMDVSVHPFCSTIGSGNDVRITTRYDEQYFPAALFGVMHEVGHALYEQGLDPAHMFTPMGTYCSLGIHESQSRFWENIIGRSRPFWAARYRSVRELLGETLAGVSLDQFYAAINTVAPSLIRVEADEVTYSLHIIVRFELERDIIAGTLGVDDIPEAWNAKMTELVGITPKNDAEGCLQDIHWSMGAFGYFPTYTLGNLYAAQLHAAAVRDLIGGATNRSRRAGNEATEGMDDGMSADELRALLDWMRKNVHQHGMRYRAAELCRQATGAPLSVEPFMDYVTAKYKPIYGL
jgi:carboxypeptidase Taq